MIYDDLPWIDIIQNTFKQWNGKSQELYGKNIDELSTSDKQWVWDEIMYDTHLQATSEEVGIALNTLMDKLRESE